MPLEAVLQKSKVVVQMHEHHQHYSRVPSQMDSSLTPGMNNDRQILDTHKYNILLLIAEIWL